MLCVPVSSVGSAVCGCGLCGGSRVHRGGAITDSDTDTALGGVHGWEAVTRDLHIAYWGQGRGDGFRFAFRGQGYADGRVGPG